MGKVRGAASARPRSFGLAAVAALAGMGCGGDPAEVPPDEPWTWDLPPGFPEPAVPADNPMSPAKVELGRALFFDPRLSENRTQSCASCHDPSRAFTDGAAVSVGSTGQPTVRSAMSLANVGYSPTLHWADPDLTSLEAQARRPISATDPVELGWAGREDALVARLAGIPGYRSQFRAAFPADPDPVRLDNLVKALAAFERTLISGGSPFDRYLAGERDALDAAALRGMELFFDERLECFHCHGGFNFSQATVHEGSTLPETAFHNTGLYNVDGRGAYPDKDRGLYDVSGRPADMGRFRAPTLRNIAVTAPYMHDGSVPTLDAAIDHYARGGRLVETGPYAGDGRASFLKSAFVSGFRLSPGEREDLKAFLRALTDTRFLENPDFRAPPLP